MACYSACARMHCAHQDSAVPQGGQHREGLVWPAPTRTANDHEACDRGVGDRRLAQGVAAAALLHTAADCGHAKCRMSAIEVLVWEMGQGLMSVQCRVTPACRDTVTRKRHAAAGSRAALRSRGTAACGRSLMRGRARHSTGHWRAQPSNSTCFREVDRLCPQPIGHAGRPSFAGRAPEAGSAAWR